MPSLNPSFLSALRRLGAFVGVCALLAGCATIPPPKALVNLMSSAPKPGADRTAYNLSVYDNVGDWVADHYYDPHYNGADWPAARARHRTAARDAKDDTELYTAINALLGELNDRHTYAQSAEDFARLFWHRNVVIGLRSIEVAGSTDGRRRILDLIPGSPAAEAGVREGWILLTCDGRRPTDVIGFNKLHDGQAVRCDFLTERGESRTLSITARQMNVPTYHRIREAADGIYVLRFDQFDETSAGWVREQVKAHSDAKGLIFDVRANPGGHFFALASILDDVFAERGELGHLVHRGGTAQWHHWIFDHGSARYAGPIAVLTSPFSTSAAEIFAQLVQERKRGPVVGQKSGGALLTSVFWPLAGGGRLWITVYDYRSPNGTRVEGQGVTPDILVPLDAIGSIDGTGNDAVVQAAVDALQGKHSDSASGAPH